jgi:hypothetical protein
MREKGGGRREEGGDRREEGGGRRKAFKCTASFFFHSECTASVLF